MTAPATSAFTTMLKWLKWLPCNARGWPGRFGSHDDDRVTTRSGCTHLGLGWTFGFGLFTLLGFGFLLSSRMITIRCILTRMSYGIALADCN